MRSPLFSWLFILSIYATLLSFQIIVISGQCLSDQQFLLLELKNSLRFNATQSKSLVKWNQSSDCCTWEGVTCEGGLVTGLKLSNESISGGIFDNSSLFSLQFLKSLDLSYNDMNSTIPSRIGELTNLSYLNFSNAGFEGQIPKEMSRLTRLVTLDFSILSYILGSSSLKLENPNLRMLVQDLTQLEELYLDGLNISASKNDWCQALSSSLPKLRVLSISSCYVSGPIDHSLQKLHSLSEIRLNYNNLSSPVPRFIANFSNLTSLHLVSCGLRGTFPEEVFQVPTLRTLDISNNKFLHGSLPEFPPHSDLQSLVIAFTHFSGRLPSSVGKLRHLSRLELANCTFTGPIPNSMTELTQLSYLDLSFNDFTGPIPSFKRSKNLTRVQLSYNHLNGTIPSGHWEGLLNLVDVDLRHNLLIGSIPSSLFSLPSLHKIQLSNNRFNDSIHLSKNAVSSVLDTLDLSSNNLQGPIPESFFEFKKLRFLSLSSNNFNGTLQLDRIQNLANLTSLDLSYNNLSINANSSDPSRSLFPNISTLKLASCNLSIFPYLKNQSKLLHLDLSDNQLQGEIPNWIWTNKGSLSHLNLSHNNLVKMQEPYSLPNLSVLDLHFNHLCGKIPILPPSASYIDLSSNKFTSSIPTDIGENLWATIFFSLSNNSLTGVIPESLCNVSYLQVLDLARNNLSGRIPACMPKMSQTLGVLNLRRNNFNGTIPDAFPVNCALETVDLSENLIEGKVPEKLANCKKLEVLNLGNNKIIDHYPCQLKKISTLRVLVLRSNKFHGPIGCPHINGTWKNLQIVDLAHNNFSGKLPGKCLLNWQGMMAEEDDVQSELKHLTFQFFQLSTSRYYQNAVTVTLKGLEVELVKIPTLFTSVDFSNNHFQGPIPKELGRLQSLFVLNLSQNALTEEIPTSLGNLRQLESLDLSRNNLTGEIPKEFVNLYFLSFLNLSDNQLAGKIPSGNQLQTFSADSFKGNKGLCGPPLTPNCSDSSIIQHGNQTSGGEYNWQSIYTGVGFGVAAAGIMALLLFWEEGRNWFDDSIDKILLVILPMMGFVYKTHDQWDNEADEDSDEEGTEFIEDCDEDEDANEDREFQGGYCVFCSKLDISKKRVIHDPKCTCHSSPPISSSSTSRSSSSSFS